MDALSGLNMSQALTELGNRNSETDTLVRSINAANEQKDEELLKKACGDFESYFIATMFKQMRESTQRINEDNAFFQKSQAEKLFTEMHDEELAKSLTASGGIGLASFLYKQLSRESITLQAE